MPSGEALRLGYPPLPALADPIDGDDCVQRVNGHPIFYLGWGVGVLAYELSKPEVTLNALAPLAQSAAFQLTLFAGDMVVDLPLSKEAAANIAEGLRTLVSEAALNERGQMPLAEADRAALRTGIARLDNLLMAELGRCDLYFVSQKRAWSTSRLIFNAELVVSSGALLGLTTSCRNDLNEAGRCIAFGLPTATGFHVFRAIESVVLQYFSLLNIPIPDLPARSLGTYIRLLKENGVDERITGMLQHLKDFYRNPIIHPEFVLQQSEAEDLFQVAASAIGAMIQDQVRRRLAKREASPEG